MKYFIVLFLFLFGCATVKTPDKRCSEMRKESGYSSLETDQEGDLYCVVLLEKHKKYTGIPKFKVGDCIKSYGSFDSVIIQIMEEDYGTSVGLDCTPDNVIERGCSTSVGRIELLDRNSVKIECPKK